MPWEAVRSVSERNQLSFCDILPFTSGSVFRARRAVQRVCFGDNLESRALVLAFRRELTPTPSADSFRTLVAELACRPEITLTEAEEEGTVCLNVPPWVCGGKGATGGRACDLGDMRLIGHRH